MPKCSSCLDAANDMQHNLLMSSFDLDLRSKLEINLSRSPYIQLDLSRRDKRDGTTIIIVHFEKKLFAVKYFAQKQLF